MSDHISTIEINTSKKNSNITIEIVWGDKTEKCAGKKLRRVLCTFFSKAPTAYTKTHLEIDEDPFIVTFEALRTKMKYKTIRWIHDKVGVAIEEELKSSYACIRNISNTNNMTWINSKIMFNPPCMSKVIAQRAVAFCKQDRHKMFRKQSNPKSQKKSPLVP
jgi:hypothetical protein